MDDLSDDSLTESDSDQEALGRRGGRAARSKGSAGENDPDVASEGTCCCSCFGSGRGVEEEDEEDKGRSNRRSGKHASRSGKNSRSKKREKRESNHRDSKRTDGRKDRVSSEPSKRPDRRRRASSFDGIGGGGSRLQGILQRPEDTYREHGDRLSRDHQGDDRFVFNPLASIGAETFVVHSDSESYRNRRGMHSGIRPRGLSRNYESSSASCSDAESVSVGDVHAGDQSRGGDPVAKRGMWASFMSSIGIGGVADSESDSEPDIHSARARTRRQWASRPSIQVSQMNIGRVHRQSVLAHRQNPLWTGERKPGHRGAGHATGKGLSLADGSSLALVTHPVGARIAASPDASSPWMQGSRGGGRQSHHVSFGRDSIT